MMKRTSRSRTRNLRLSSLRLRVETLESRLQPGTVLGDGLFLGAMANTTDLWLAREGRSASDDGRLPAIETTDVQATHNLVLIPTQTTQVSTPASSLSQTEAPEAVNDAALSLTVAAGRHNAVVTQNAAVVTPVAVEGAKDRQVSVRSLGAESMAAVSEETVSGAVTTQSPVNLQPQLRIVSERTPGPEGVGLDASTYIGTAGADAGNDVRLAADGLLYGTGCLDAGDGTTVAAVAVATTDLTTVGIAALGFVGATYTCGSGIDLDDAGNMYITGTTNAPGQGLAFVASIAPDFTTIRWAVGYLSDGSTPAPGCGSDAPNLDACGNGIDVNGAGTEVTMTGSLVREGANPGRAMLLARLNGETGDQIWGFTYRFRRATAEVAGDTEGEDVAVDSSGNPFVSGQFVDLTSAADGNQLLTGKFNPAGGFVSGILFINDGDDRGLGITLSPFGEPRVAGFFAKEAGAPGSDTALAVFDAGVTGGGALVVEFIDTTSAGRDVALDEGGNAVVVGVVGDPADDQDALVLRIQIEPADLLDVVTIATDNRPALGTDAANAVATGAFGTTYVAGTTNSADFPTTAGAFQTEAQGDNDAFATALTIF